MLLYKKIVGHDFRYDPRMFCRHKSQRCFLFGVDCCGYELLYFRIWRTASQTQEMFEIAFGENDVGRTQTFEWLFSIHTWGNFCWILRAECRFATRQEENVVKVRKVINKDQRGVISKISGRLGLSYVTCLQIKRVVLMDFFEVCVLAAHWLGESADIFGCYKQFCGVATTKIAWGDNLWFFLISKQES